MTPVASSGAGRRTADRSPVRAPDQALRASGGKAWDKMLAWLRKEATEGEPRAVARAIAAEYRRFSAAVMEEEGELIANPLLWNDDELAFGRWVEGAFHELARAASSVLRRLDRAGADPGPESAVAEVAAVALSAVAASMKWVEISGLPRRTASVAEAHQAFGLAKELGLAESAPSLPVAPGREVALTITAHYARALMLEAFCRGNLTRQQVAVLDAWLWEWSGAYRLCAGPATGALLAVDAGGTRGLRALEAGENLPALVLAIEPLAGQIEHVVRELQAGRIFPGYGVATTFRVEVHVALLDALRAFLDVSRSGLAKRQGREGVEEVVTVFVGLPEILAKANLPLPAIRPVARGTAGTFNIDSQYEIPRRSLRLVDESTSGLGLEGEEGDQGLEVGTLLGLLREDGAPALLAEVARRVAMPGGRVRLGVRILSRALRELHLAKGTGRGPTRALYLAGPDSSGRQDSVLLAQSDFDPLADYEIGFPGRTYRVRLNRVRHQGRGWLLAGLEVVEGRVEPEPFTLSLAE
jgi:hypothetical protein